MYKLKWTRLQMEILRLLCIKSGQILNLRGIANYLKVSPTAVSNALNELEKENLVKINKSKIMNLFSIELNRDNPKTTELKRIENIKMFYDSGLYDFLFNEFPGCAIILFGSYSRGEDILGLEDLGNMSDIDIAVIGTKGKQSDLTKFEKLLERKIILNFYHSFKEIHKHLKENIFNGFLLSGGIEL